MAESTLNSGFAPAVLAQMTSEFVATYVSNNRVQPSDLPALISSVHAALASLVRRPEPAVAKPKRRVSIRKSVTDEYIVSLEDGKPYKALKRHLKRFGLTPKAYREKWGLPVDYPIVAAAFARERSSLAKQMGLGGLLRRSKV